MEKIPHQRPTLSRCTIRMWTMFWLHPRWTRFVWCPRFGIRIDSINELDSYFNKKILDRIYRIDWIFLFPNFPERKLGNSIRLRRKLTSHWYGQNFLLRYWQNYLFFWGLIFFSYFFSPEAILYPVNPVDPVKKILIKIGSIPFRFRILDCGIRKARISTFWI